MRILIPTYRWLLRLGLLLAAGLYCAGLAGLQTLRESPTTAPRDPVTGIMKGAEPIRVDRGRDRACLLLHGWVTTPADFGGLPKALDEAGWDVYAPLHPGHGTTPRELEGVTADDLLGAARDRFDELQKRYQRVALIGFSMGGTVATILAAEPGPRPPDRLVLIAPFFGVRHHWYYVLPAGWWSKLLSPFVRYVKRSPRLMKVNRPEGRDEIVSYTAFPATASEALFGLQRRAAGATEPGRLAMPVLLVCSTADYVCALKPVEHFYDRLPSAHKRKAILSRSNHHILHDYDREQAIRTIVEFLGHK